MEFIANCTRNHAITTTNLQKMVCGAAGSTLAASLNPIQDVPF